MKPNQKSLSLYAKIHNSQRNKHTIYPIMHLVIAEKAYLSFKDEGIMDDLKKSDTWRLMSKEEWAFKELRAEAQTRIREEKLQKEIVRKMLEEGMTVDFIVKVTGLRKSVVAAMVRKKK